MSCERIQKNVPSFLQGSLERSLEEEVLQHLNQCVSCRVFYQNFRQNQVDVKPEPPTPKSR